MISFDSKDPFPLLEYGSFSYEDAKAHALLVDNWLGVRSTEIETGIGQNERYSPEQNMHGFHTEYWRGLPVQTMQTPYIEIRCLLAQLNLKEGAVLVDLGCAYGRMAHVVGRHHPQINFVGYEFLKERVIEGLRTLAPFGYSNVALIQADLSLKEFKPVPAACYFIYDFGSRHAIEKTLEDLRVIASMHPVTVVGRGRNSRQIIERGFPWLAEVVMPEHYVGYSIYRSANN